MCQLAGRVMSPDGRQNSLIAASVPGEVSWAHLGHKNTPVHVKLPPSRAV